jgi:hypothetical protein
MKSNTKLIVLSMVLAAVLGVGLVFCLVVLPMASQAKREAERRDQTMNELKQIEVALDQYNKRSTKFPDTSITRKAALAFDTYSGYFVSNKFEPNAAESFVVLNDQEEFDKVFGAAMVMDDKSHWLPKNAFKSQIVIAVIKRGSSVVEYKVEGVTVKGGVVELGYSTTSKKSDTATFASPLIVSIPRGKYQAVQFVEDKNPVRKVALH